MPNPSRGKRAKRRVVKLVEQGLPFKEVASRTSLPPKTVLDWHRLYLYDGIEGLFELPERKPGFSVLLAGQRAYLSWLIDRSAEAQGWEDDVWTMERIQTLLDDQFGVSADHTTVSQILRSLGFAHDGVPTRKETVVPDGLRQLDRLRTAFERHHERVAKRLEIARLLERGVSMTKIAKQVGVSTSIVSKIKRLSEEHGNDILKRFYPDSKKKLPAMTERQRQRVLKLVEAGPAACGLDGTWWSEFRLKRVIEDVTGLTYGSPSIGWIVELFADRWDLLEHISQQTGRGWVRRRGRPLEQEPDRCDRCDRIFVTGMRLHLCEERPLAAHFKGKPGYLKKQFHRLLGQFRRLGSFSVVSLGRRIDLEHERLFASVRVGRKRLNGDLYVGSPQEQLDYTDVEILRDGFRYGFTLESAHDFNEPFLAAVLAAYRYGMGERVG